MSEGAKRIQINSSKSREYFVLVDRVRGCNEFNQLNNTMTLDPLARPNNGGFPGFPGFMEASAVIGSFGVQGYLLQPQRRIE